MKMYLALFFCLFQLFCYSQKNQSDSSNGKCYEKVRKDIFETVSEEGETIVKRILKSSTHSWKQVLCEDQITDFITIQVIAALKKRNYLPVNFGKEFDAKAKEGLITFQKDNDLTEGFFDFETLDMLEIFY